MSTNVGFSPSPYGIVIASAGAAAMIAGAIAGGIALAQDADARASCLGTRCTPEAYAAAGGAHGIANVADGLLWGGLGVLGVGAILMFVLPEEDGESAGTTPSAACTANGCIVAITGSF